MIEIPFRKKRDFFVPGFFFFGARRVPLFPNFVPAFHCNLLSHRTAAAPRQKDFHYNRG